VENPLLQATLRSILDEHLADQRSAWDMKSDGSYVQRQPQDAEAVSCQQRLAQFALERDRQAKRLKRRKPRTIARRNVSLSPAKS